MTNIKILNEKIRKSGYKLTFIAEQCGLTYQGLLPKLKGKREFTQSEISALRDLLKLTLDEITEIFFADEVDETSTEETA